MKYILLCYCTLLTAFCFGQESKYKITTLFENVNFTHPNELPLSNETELLFTQENNGQVEVFIYDTETKKKATLATEDDQDIAKYYQSANGLIEPDRYALTNYFDKDFNILFEGEKYYDVKEIENGFLVEKERGKFYLHNGKKISKELKQVEGMLFKGDNQKYLYFLDKLNEDFYILNTKGKVKSKLKNISSPKGL